MEHELYWNPLYLHLMFAYAFSFLGSLNLSVMMTFCCIVVMVGNIDWGHCEISFRDGCISSLDCFSVMLWHHIILKRTPSAALLACH